MEEHPNLKILALIFKKFLSLKNLNKPFSGGLSSYSLIQMILAILKLEENFMTKPSVSLLFKKFVYEYGCMFKPMETAIAQDCMFYDKNEMSYIMHTP